jgi:periplasmic protein CpxP/Spy
MNNTKFLKTAVLLLLVANIALVAFILLGKSGKVGRGGRPDMTEMLAKELGLSDEQKSTHRQINEEHRKVTKPLMDSIRTAKKNLYEAGKLAIINDSIINAHTNKIAALQISFDKSMLGHFQKVRALLKPEQQIKFDTLVLKMISRSRRDGGRRE